MLVASDDATAGSVVAAGALLSEAAMCAGVIGGLIYAAYLVHMPAHWIVAGAVVLLGLGILTGVKATRQKDPVG